MVQTRPSPVTANALAGRKPGYQKAVTGGRPFPVSVSRPHRPTSSGAPSSLWAMTDRSRRQARSLHPSAVGPAEVAAQVEQRQVLERHRGPGGERGQLGPFLAEASAVARRTEAR